MLIENENNLRQALGHGINIFTGAGFSILAENAEGNKLPLGTDLATELIQEFNDPSLSNLDLSKISTILEYDKKQAFYQFVKKRFTVERFDPRYSILNDLRIKTIFTTNVDDLIHKIFVSSKTYHLNDINLKGPAFKDRTALDFLSLHGCVLDNTRPMTFGTRDLASAFSAEPDSWRFLTNRLSEYPTLFWGHGIEDSGVLEALNPKQKEHKPKWLILNPTSVDEGQIQYFRAMDFQIIKSSTDEFLDYLSKIGIRESEKISKFKSRTTIELFPDEALPDIGAIPVRPIIDFYFGAAPSWSDIYSGRIYKTSHFSKICDLINAKRHTLIMGLPACGKTTLLMQVAAEIEFSGHKLAVEYMSQEKAELIKSQLNDEPALIFIDNFTDSIDAINTLSGSDNILLACFDRYYNFDIISHRINKRLFQILEVTELTQRDIQEIFSRIPPDIRLSKLHYPSTSAGERPSLFEIVESNISKSNLRERFNAVLKEIDEKDSDLLDLLLVCCYVHRSRTPVSMDMLLAYFRDSISNFSQIYTLRDGLRKLLSDYTGELDDGEQDYFVPRSTIMAEAVIEQAPSSALKRILIKFHSEVSHYRIHRFDIFRRQAYDADLMRKAFSQWQEGLEFYKSVCSNNSSPYLRQQCALYLAHKRRFTEAFTWIDEAIVQSGGKIPSINNSHAVILFKANIDREDTDGTVRRTLKQSMDILQECYAYDKRKTYHALVFGEQALKYFEVYADETAISYLQKAKKWLDEEYKISPWHPGVKRVLNQVRRTLQST